MKKVTILLVAAGLFITGVMLYLIQSGIKTRQRKMVKWSAVESPEAAGQKIGRFFFPILKETSSLEWSGDSEFAHHFFEGFQKTAQEISPRTQLTFNAVSNGEKKDSSFYVEIIEPVYDSCLQKCNSGDYPSCVCLTALKKFSKKQRDPKKDWIHMVRMSKNQALLFFVEKKK